MQASSGVFGDFSDPDYLNARFLPVIKNSPTISSILITNDLWEEYLLLTWREKECRQVSKGRV
jgi:hypothetical protein